MALAGAIVKCELYKQCVTLANQLPPSIGSRHVVDVEWLSTSWLLATITNAIFLQQFSALDLDGCLFT